MLAKLLLAVAVLCPGLLLFATGPKAVIEWDRGSLATLYDPGDGFYSYAPAVVRDGEIERYWTCRNREPGVVRDHIYYFERRDGQRSGAHPVLSPGPEGAWDSFHVCDPAVIEGEFRFAGETYRYAMFYLGNKVDASRDNQIGVAFSNELDGTWKRYPNPIVPFPPRGFWGVGQPAVTSVNRKGRVLLFYTKGMDVQLSHTMWMKVTASFVREMDLSDMDRPKVGPAVRITNNGLTRADGTADYLNNFDIVYNSESDRFIAVRGQRPYESDNPSYISPRLQIVSIEARHILEGTGAWRVEGLLTPEITSHSRNHNAGIERTLFGELPETGRLRIIFATARTTEHSEAQRPLWTYSLWEIEGKVGAEASPEQEGGGAG